MPAACDTRHPGARPTRSRASGRSGEPGGRGSPLSAPGSHVRHVAQLLLDRAPAQDLAEAAIETSRGPRDSGDSPLVFARRATHTTLLARGERVEPGDPWTPGRRQSAMAGRGARGGTRPRGAGRAADAPLEALHSRRTPPRLIGCLDLCVCWA